MLQKIYIQNFQSHAKTKVEFDEKVTTIVGSSDVGKSAIIRALRWLSLNSPQGSAFISEGEQGASVQLVIGDRTVKRRRTKNENGYYLDDKEYKAFGSSVPEEIADLLAVTDLNFQQQHDAPFWLSLSAGEVSRQLNEIVDLGVIDSALSKSSKKSKDLKKELQVSEKWLKKAKQDNEDLEWVHEAELHWRKVQQKHAEETRESDAAARLQKMLVQLHTAQQTRHSANAAFQKGAVVLAKAEKIKTAHSKLDQLENLITSIKQLQTVAPPSLGKLEELSQEILELKKAANDLESIMDETEDAVQFTEKSNHILSQVQQRLQKMTQNENCPVCGGVFDAAL